MTTGKAEKIKRETAEVMAAAYAANLGYGQFIKPLSQKKNIGTQESPVWVEIETPYMTVDGRIQMLVDDKEAVPFCISPVSFEQGPDGTLLARVTVSTRKGTASGTAKVGIGGKGIDARNPYENAETSAIGRALGFLGYGLLGGGIASYEEVKGTIEDREKPPVTKVSEMAKPSMSIAATASATTPAPTSIRSAMPAQLNAIRNMAKKAGISEVEKILVSLDFKKATEIIAALSKGDVSVLADAA